MHVTKRIQRGIGVGLAVLGLTLVAGGSGAAAGPRSGGHHDHGLGGGQQRVLDRIELPDGFLPEGIAIGREPVAYLGSRADGDIYAADLRTGKGSVISQGPGTPSVGVKLDGSGRLFVAGGSGGDGRVVDTRTGKVLASWTFTTGTSFVNDVVLTKTMAWFTDSANARLYGVRLDDGRPGKGHRHHGPAGHRGGRDLPAGFLTLPLTGQWTQTPEVNNANGIVETPDGKALLVVKSDTGELFRVDQRSGVATKVDLGDTVLSNGDGLLLEGRTLYAVQNRLNKVAVVTLNDRGTRGRLQKTITSADFDVPSTVAAYGKSLFLPNARFTSPQEPTTKFWITRVDR